VVTSREPGRNRGRACRFGDHSVFDLRLLPGFGLEFTMNKQVKKLWLAALRSGKYKQTTGQLRYGQKRENLAYCCLGVLEDLAVKAGVIHGFNGRDGVLGKKVMEWAGLNEPSPVAGTGPWRYLADANDCGKNFRYIADRIEKYL
jgi:hypothetical protein